MEVTEKVYCKSYCEIMCLFDENHSFHPVWDLKSCRQSSWYNLYATFIFIIFASWPLKTKQVYVFKWDISQTGSLFSYKDCTFSTSALQLRSHTLTFMAKWRDKNNISTHPSKPSMCPVTFKGQSTAQTTHGS